MNDTPDYSTISRFRSRLLGLKMYDKLFDEINRQLVKKGSIVRERSAVVVERVVIELANRPEIYKKHIRGQGRRRWIKAKIVQRSFNIFYVLRFFVKSKNRIKFYNYLIL